uniref:J domain-containing protein n=1 Tax=Odontella aurita TaxID=265563 RepID=A0A7S4HHV8_9STRA|mmetsp:Transcript_10218/g.30182  ORF Transcript_10218/g.30182 Transcript_10218/m.30182 type:complete len:437 (+) Transcript_10218:598-1908(+)
MTTMTVPKSQLIILLKECTDHLERTDDFSPIFHHALGALHDHVGREVVTLQSQIASLQATYLAQQNKFQQAAAAQSTVPKEQSIEVIYQVQSKQQPQPKEMDEGRRNLLDLEKQKKAAAKKRQQEVIERRRKAAAEQKKKEQEEKRKFRAQEQRKQELKANAAKAAKEQQQKASANVRGIFAGVPIASSLGVESWENEQRDAIPRPSPTTPADQTRLNAATAGEAKKECRSSAQIPVREATPPQTARVPPIAPSNAQKTFPPRQQGQSHPPKQQQQKQECPTSSPLPHHAPTGMDQKYKNMSEQTQKDNLSNVTALKRNILLHWALQPPELQILRPLDHLLCSVHTVCPPSFGVPAHSYFSGWKPIPRTELCAPDGTLDDEKIKKAVRKVRFFLHPDKLPRDLTDEQEFACKLLWDITNDAFEDFTTAQEHLDWIQ